MEIKQDDVLQSGYEFTVDLQVELGTDAYRYLRQIYLETRVVDGLLKHFGFPGKATVVDHQLMERADILSALFIIRSVA